MFLMGAGALSELRDYQQRARSTRRRSPRHPGNFLPILYKPEMMEEIWKYLHKPRYVDPGQLNGVGETAARVATQFWHPDIVELLQGLGVDGGDNETDGDVGSDDDGDSGGDSAGSDGGDNGDDGDNDDDA